MSSKIRVWKVAVELGIEPQDMVDKLQLWGYHHINTHMSVLTDEEVNKIKNFFLEKKKKDIVEEKIEDGLIKRHSEGVTTPQIQQIKKQKKKATEFDVSILKSKPLRPVPPTSTRVNKKNKLTPPEDALLPSSFPQIEENVEQENKQHQLISRKIEINMEETSQDIKSSEVTTANKNVIEKDKKIIIDIGNTKYKTDTTEKSAQTDQIFLQPLRPEPPKSTRIVEPVKKEALQKKKIQLEETTHENINQQEIIIDTNEKFVSEEAPKDQESSYKKKSKGAPRRREVIRGKDLVEDAKEKYFKAQRAKKKKIILQKTGKKPEITQPKESKRIIKIQGSISVQELAKQMGIKSSEVLMKLMQMGVLGININSNLDSDTSKIIASEFQYQVEDVAFTDTELINHARKGIDEKINDSSLILRPPVVTIMGHVDHGKTSILDYIRKTKVTAGEAGGITQHIGAYTVSLPKGNICFIDTPGHEAFTEMRARGANITDIVVLVVAADDGVMPQTKEAIAHAKAADVPIIVAINKIDIPGVNVDRVKRDLTEQGLVPEDWGGDTIICEVSARTGAGIDHLLEMILLQSEVLELKAAYDIPAKGVVIEARLEKGEGPVATILITEGKLQVGDYIIAGLEHGKVRSITDETGKRLKEATPSTAVEVSGISGVPMAGDQVDVITETRKLNDIIEIRKKKQKESPLQITPDKLIEMMKAKQVECLINVLNVVLRGDVQGSIEAIKNKLDSLNTEELKINILFAGVGGITENDVMLASSCGRNSIIIGFNVRPSLKAKQLADQDNIPILFHNIIYELEEDIKNRLRGLSAPKYEEHHIGSAEVRQTFNIPKIGTIAGCIVQEGKISRGSKVRLLRDSVQIWDGKLSSLKRFKDDVKEVQAGYECGIGFEGFNDIKISDIIQAYEIREINTGE